MQHPLLEEEGRGSDLKSSPPPSFGSKKGEGGGGGGGRGMKGKAPPLLISPASNLCVVPWEIISGYNRFDR